MNETTSQQYCHDLALKQRPDAFLASLYLPEDCRRMVHVALALDSEFDHIGHVAREELIAHLRYAWWEEALEKTFAGSPPPGHPVLAAVAASNLAKEKAVALLAAYRSQYPDIPEGAAEAWVQEIVENCGAEAGWHKARRIITTHREKYGPRKNGWLQLKLLVGGVV